MADQRVMGKAELKDFTEEARKLMSDTKLDTFNTVRRGMVLKNLARLESYEDVPVCKFEYLWDKVIEYASVVAVNNELDKYFRKGFHESVGEFLSNERAFESMKSYLKRMQINPLDHPNSRELGVRLALIKKEDETIREDRAYFMIPTFDRLISILNPGHSSYDESEVTFLMSSKKSRELRCIMAETMPERDSLLEKFSGLKEHYKTGFEAHKKVFSEKYSF